MSRVITLVLPNRAKKNLPLSMAYFERLFDYIGRKTSVKLTQDERNLIMSTLKSRRLRKRQFFLQEGDVCQYLGFIVRGATRLFADDKKGHEHILKFGVEEGWAGDYESFYLLTPSKYYIEALDDVDMILITNEQLQEFIRTIPAIRAMMEAMDRASALANTKRMHAAISFNAEERYEDLVRTYPHFLQRFPQNMIASYLGISPETLSRIRHSACKKEKAAHIKAAT